MLHSVLLFGFLYISAYIDKVHGWRQFSRLPMISSSRLSEQSTSLDPDASHAQALPKKGK